MKVIPVSIVIFISNVTEKGLLPLVLTDEVEEKEQSEMPF